MPGATHIGCCRPPRSRDGFWCSLWRNYSIRSEPASGTGSGGMLCFELTEAVETQRESLTEESLRSTNGWRTIRISASCPDRLRPLPTASTRTPADPVHRKPQIASDAQPSIGAMAMPDAELRIAIKRMLIGLPNMRFEHIDPSHWSVYANSFR